ncbi:hypothetical protein FDA33_10270 [Clostridium botulinum]|uniref:Uncharacterized protein n=1 Tax=Clostridium botulinum TaxID=1491 RepID=A0A0M1LCE5_CLOBO|nr:hypothetical protein [Clostridium botulinum]ALT05390.1 hypothetical protein [Clostridium botulinum]ALT05900.1 hypothetical protein [Clostridium botulinum]KOR55323.1 hypothetical protein ADT22_17090 [Clostridium botulinum]MBN1050380.1 hypothetical protein [Clostridium botulinum]MBY6811057.1 hypothetical protein [Clostridium botulinum]
MKQNNNTKSGTWEYIVLGPNNQKINNNKGNLPILNNRDDKITDEESYLKYLYIKDLEKNETL